MALRMNPGFDYNILGDFLFSCNIMEIKTYFLLS